MQAGVPSSGSDSAFQHDTRLPRRGGHAFGAAGAAAEDRRLARPGGGGADRHGCPCSARTLSGLIWMLVLTVSVAVIAFQWFFGGASAAMHYASMASVIAIIVGSVLLVSIKLAFSLCRRSGAADARALPRAHGPAVMVVVASVRAAHAVAPALEHEQREREQPRAELRREPAQEMHDVMLRSAICSGRITKAASSRLRPAPRHSRSAGEHALREADQVPARPKLAPARLAPSSCSGSAAKASARGSACWPSSAGRPVAPGALSGQHATRCETSRHAARHEQAPARLRRRSKSRAAAAGAPPRRRVARRTRRPRRRCAPAAPPGKRHERRRQPAQYSLPDHPSCRSLKPPWVDACLHVGGASGC